MAPAAISTATRPPCSEWARVNRPILIVDDDEGIRTMLSECLAEFGYPTAVAEHGQAALAWVRHFQPALILLDLRMPVMDGWAFLDAYRQLGGWPVPVIVLTAASDAAQVAARVGAAGCLAKPFDLEDLIDLVAACAGSPPGGTPRELGPAPAREAPHLSHPQSVESSATFVEHVQTCRRCGIRYSVPVGEPQFTWCVLCAPSGRISVQDGDTDSNDPHQTAKKDQSHRLAIVACRRCGESVHLPVRPRASKAVYCPGCVPSRRAERSPARSVARR